MTALTTLFGCAWSQAAPLVQQADEPHAELLALVWGPRFDLQHAQELLGRAPPPAAPALWRTLVEAARTYDSLPGERQQQLRRFIVQHHRRWENSRHAPHPAD